MSFEIQERDAYILEKINVIMKNTRPIYFRKKRKESQQNQKKIDIISDKICNDLINLGMNFRKTWDLRYPDFIDKEFQGDFIRGFFDGDGCICKNKKINNAMWYICGNLQMVIDIKNHLFRQGIEATVYESDRYSQPFGIVYITNLKNIKKIYNYMYDNVDDLFLTRKKEKFLQLDFKKMEYFNVKRDIVEILYLAGETTSEIAKRLKYTYAEVHNAIKSIENKIKKAQL